MGECRPWRHSAEWHSRELIQSWGSQAVRPGGEAREHETVCYKARWQTLSEAFDNNSVRHIKRSLCLCRGLRGLFWSLLSRSNNMCRVHWFWACAAGAQAGTSTDLQHNSYTVIWQASSQCSSVAWMKTVSAWVARWLFSAGQLWLRGPSPQPGKTDRSSAVFAALQRMLAFLQTGGLAGEASFPQAQPSLLDLSFSSKEPPAVR